MERKYFLWKHFRYVRWHISITSIILQSRPITSRFNFQSTNRTMKCRSIFYNISIRASKSTRFGDTFIRMIIIRFLKSSFFFKKELSLLSSIWWDRHFNQIRFNFVCFWIQSFSFNVSDSIFKISVLDRFIWIVNSSGDRGPIWFSQEPNGCDYMIVTLMWRGTSNDNNACMHYQIIFI